MDFFREHPVNDSVLSGLGIHDQKTRSLLIGHFNSLLCYSSDDFGKALVVLLEATSTVAQRAVASDAALDSLRLENLRLSTKLGEMEDEARALRAEGELARMQKADLIVIVDKQREGLAAYKEKCAMHRKEGKEMRGAYDRLMRRAAGLEALNASLGADKAALECRLRVAEASAENERAVRLKARRARKEWASRSGSAPLPRLHGLFRAAVGVASASSLMTAAGRAQRLKAPGSKVAMGRRRAAHFLSVAAERDDALRAKEALEQELQRVREQAAHARRGLAASSDELLSLRAELRRRSDAERAIREQHFYDSFVGAPIVCPMPTMDGSLVALADIYREWRPSSSSSSSGDGRAVAASSDFAFAATGRTTTSLAPIGVINLVRGVAGVVGADTSLPFVVQFRTSGGAVWSDFPLVDQLDIVARLCCFLRAGEEGGASPLAHHPRAAYGTEVGADAWKFRVLGAALFEIFLVAAGDADPSSRDGGQGMAVRTAQGLRAVGLACGVGSTAYGVRIVGAGDFFVGKRAALAAEFLVDSE